MLDGLIRLEVHPELSTGSVQVSQGLSLPQKAVTQVTTQVICPDGCTIVRLTDTAFAVDGMPQRPARGKVRSAPARSAGPP